MRSRDSANRIIISVWPPRIMWLGKIKEAAIARIHGSVSATRKRSRRSRKLMARPRSTAISLPASGDDTLLVSIKSFRFNEQDQHSDGIDAEAAGIGEQIFAGGVAQAEH